MRIKRLLDDREVLDGDRLFGVQGRSIRFKPVELDCYVTLVNRTDRGLVKELLRSFWED